MNWGGDQAIRVWQLIEQLAKEADGWSDVKTEGGFQWCDAGLWCRAQSIWERFHNMDKVREGRHTTSAVEKKQRWQHTHCVTESGPADPFLSVSTYQLNWWVNRWIKALSPLGLSTSFFVVVVVGVGGEVSGGAEPSELSLPVIHLGG